MKISIISAVLATTVLVSGCQNLANTDSIIDGTPRVPAGENEELSGIGEAPIERNDINATEMGKRLQDITKTETPDLKELMNISSGLETKDGEELSEEDKLRMPALKDAALAYGARGGLAYTSREINKMLQKRAAEFDRIYDFSRLMVRGPDGVMVLPPVISEARDAYEVTDAGKALRVADQVYEIVEQSRFSPNAPLWYAYLIRDYSVPTPPPDEILPKNADERKYWNKHVAEGWKAGAEQAQAIFKADLNRLERDYTGMARFRALLAEGKVSPPIVAAGRMGVTGTGQDMRVNDRSIRIMEDPSLITDTSQWDSTVSGYPKQIDSLPAGENGQIIIMYPRKEIRQY